MGLTGLGRHHVWIRGAGVPLNARPLSTLAERPYPELCPQGPQRCNPFYSSPPT